MIDTKALTEGLVAAHAALVEKIGKQPYIEHSLSLEQTGKWVAGGAYLAPDMNERLSGPFCDTPEGAIAGLMDAIRRLPSSDERNLQKFQRLVADAIDFGNSAGIEAEWVNPLVDMARKIAENAITHEASK